MRRFERMSSRSSTVQRTAVAAGVEEGFESVETEVRREEAGVGTSRVPLNAE